MPVTPEPFTISGGCFCRSIRYQIDVPEAAARPKIPYCTPGAQVPEDARIPFTCIDHCNDCRLATSALLPFCLITEASTGKLSFNDGPWKPVLDLWMKPLSEFQEFSTLGHYRSSPGRNRWFCSKCGTMLWYTVSDGVLPADWKWPTMLDIWMGTVDRDCLEKEYMRPERMLWCQSRIPWIGDLARSGAGGIPEHPLTKIDKEIGDDVGEDFAELRNIKGTAG